MPAAERDLGLLTSVHVNVTAELGAATMSLADILDLSAGAVVDLDRSIEEPVDIRVNGKLVARGEIVAINDKFGVRVTELVRSA